MSQKIFVHLAEGFEEIEAMATIDILLRGELDTVIVSMMDDLVVKSVRGVGIKCDAFFQDVNYEDCSMMVLPGGYPGVTNLGNHQGLCHQLKNFSEEEKWIAAICAAPVILHDQGLLTGKTLTCFPGLGDDFHEATVKTDPVVVYGKLITSQGPGTAIEFGLKIIEMLQGKEQSDFIRGKLLA